MKIPTFHPLKIILLGAGGTGGYIAPHLYRIAYSANRQINILIADGDIVESKNLIRQNFVQSDIGENKAKIIAERYSDVFGIATNYLPQFIESEEQLKELVSVDYNYYPYEIPILIGAVDNNRSRQMCHSVFCNSQELIYIDSGNGEHTGQVVCGVRKGSTTIRNPVAEIYPDILEDVEKFPTELSCAERSVSAPQSISANLFASTAVVSLLYSLIILGELETNKTTFSARSLAMKSI